MKKEDRMQWLWDNFGAGYPEKSFAFEQYFQAILRTSCGELSDVQYRFFDFIDEDNGAKWMRISSPFRKKKFHVHDENHQFEGEMTGEALCLGAMLVTTKDLCWMHTNQQQYKFSNLYFDLNNKLRMFATDHKEGKAILAFADSMVF